jgi:glycosyltransferase involved in cell wall biosynthesis
MARARVTIVLNALHSGGTEATCIELARELREEYELEVVSLGGGGPAEEQLRAADINTRILSNGKAREQLAICLELRHLFRKSRPNAVLTFLYLSDLLGGTMARTYAPAAKVFWNIRNNVLRRGQTGQITYLASRANARLSRIIPHQIVYCSRVAREQHESIGYYPAVAAVVENSPLSVPFAFSSLKRCEFRQNGIADDYVFLFVGRFDPIKRVDLYLMACGALCRDQRQRTKFVIAGRDMDHSNLPLRNAIASAGVADRVQLLGHVADLQLLYSAADCLVVTSESEGSPNVVYEAMATRLPVIIMGTVGTEEIRGPGVTRLPQRDVAVLADTMASLAARGPLPPSVRMERADAAPQIAPHPLAAHYKRVLAGV